MARQARLVFPDIPHHIVQRGARRMRTFFCETDYRTYIALLREACEETGVRIWAYCLMPNHVHLIAVPKRAGDFSQAIGEAHRRYAWRINRREEITGHLWQARFASYPMDTPHLLAAARYIELNPVAARLVTHAPDWPWSSARAHLARRDDALVDAKPLNDMILDWGAFLDAGSSAQAAEIMAKHERTGLPLGAESFIDTLEKSCGRRLRPERPGPKERSRSSGTAY